MGDAEKRKVAIDDSEERSERKSRRKRRFDDAGEAGTPPSPDPTSSSPTPPPVLPVPVAVVPPQIVPPPDVTTPTFSTSVDINDVPPHVRQTVVAPTFLKEVYDHYGATAFVRGSPVPNAHNLPPEMRQHICISAPAKDRADAAANYVHRIISDMIMGVPYTLSGQGISLAPIKVYFHITDVLDEDSEAVFNLAARALGEKGEHIEFIESCVGKGKVAVSVRGKDTYGGHESVPPYIQIIPIPPHCTSLDMARAKVLCEELVQVVRRQHTEFVEALPRHLQKVKEKARDAKRDNFMPPPMMAPPRR